MSSGSRCNCGPVPVKLTTPAGVAALMLQADPNLSPTQVSAILAQTAAPVAGGFGAGLIQADAAITMAQAMIGRSSFG